LRKRATSRIELPTAMVSMLVISPMTSKFIDAHIIAADSILPNAPHNSFIAADFFTFARAAYPPFQSSPM
jgi:hypothetical protein